MIKKPNFYALWLTYTIGCLAGLMAIGIASPYGTTVANITPELADFAVSLFAIFNFAGRPIFGSLTDKFTHKNTAMVSFVLIFAASAILYFGGEENELLYFVGFGMLWLCLGGWLAIAPAATKIFFGTEHYGKNYGLVFTAYGVGAIAGTWMSGGIKVMTGSYLGAFPIVMVLAVIGLIVAFIGLKPTKRD